ncbi:actin-7-related [Anaeramoeba ignava]|uniref:Actin-7-related n=1 Tax=Anaeramoeba ignava TaxID=1746090 RepID=A0A9Q0RFW6_ANAIG|nr:actin-7-related [Anaeramoeba ignava]
MAEQIIIIDNGSQTLKVGYAGDDAPYKILPTIIGKPKNKELIQMFGGKEYYIGDSAKAKSGILNLNYPIKHGIITNWDDMERIWYDAFYNELRIIPEEDSFLFTESPLNPKENREKTTEIMFESFDVHSFYLANSAMLAMYQSGKKTGIIVEIGDDFSSVVPIYDGFCLPDSIMKSNLAGREITNYLIQNLNQKGIEFKTTYEKDMIEDLKKKTCYKLLFKPSLIGIETQGIHQMICNSLNKISVGIRKELYQNIILSGGSSLFPGLTERIQKEVSQLLPLKIKIQIISPPERWLSTWIGASILASTSNFAKMWITKEDYQENGPKIVHQKCF